jgi:hypothetical protein
MGFFGKKKGKVLDWSENYRVSEKRIPMASSHSKPETVGDLEFLGSFSNSNNSSSSDVSWDNDSTPQNDYPDKKQKLAKRLLEMTNRLEDLSNQVYHLKQRIELLEKKLRIDVD